MTIPERKNVPKEHQWDLGKLYASDGDWEKGLTIYKEDASKIASYRGTLGKSALTLKACLDFMTDMGMREERLGYYAHLRQSEDGGDSRAADMYARFMQASVTANAEAGYINPEILAVPE